MGMGIITELKIMLMWMTTISIMIMVIISICISIITTIRKDIPMGRP
tara:strand:+ start:369 stop:509 length:141 start_codon:yes stop_codon:yes gene_type:complete